MNGGGMAREIYSTEFKKQVVREYEQENFGYKKLAKMYNLDRDTVRNWVLNPRLHDKESPEGQASTKSIENPVKDIEYYREAAAYWENYAHQLEAQIEEKLLTRSFLPDSDTLL